MLFPLVLAVLSADLPTIAAPLLRNPGVHVVATDGSAARWLGPGMDPAWSPDGRTLYLIAAHGPLGAPPFGPLYAVDVATRTAHVVREDGHFAACRPSPDGQRLLALRRVTDSGPVMLTTFGLDGRPLEPDRPLGPWSPALRAMLGAPPPDAAHLETGPAGARLVAADGKLLADIDPAVPTTADPDGAVVTALSPDGKWLAVSLGRTDRWGLTAQDVLRTTDTDVGNHVCHVERRVRDVGPSGVVFASSGLKCMGQAAPAPDSSVVGRVEPGSLRWMRPAPPRWVVLHHTGSSNDHACLNSLTTHAPWKLAGLYEDITPRRDETNEPSTLAVHYLVYRDGTVVQLVEERYIARHVGTGQWCNRGPIYDFNPETIGIEIVSPGNDYTPAQVKSVGCLVADICLRHGIPFRHVPNEPFTEGVLYHKDVSAGLRGKPDPSGWPWEAMAAAGEAWLARRPIPTVKEQ